MTDKPLDTDEEEDDSCGEPCDPDAPCGGCAGYWERMIQEGYWDGDRHRWTEKGWREMTKL